MVRRGIRGRRAVVWSAAAVLVAGGAVAADAARHLAGDYHVYTVRSRAMMPLLEPGDRVLVADTVTVQDGGVVLLDAGRAAMDGPVFKRILGHADDRLYCCSEDGIRRNGAAMDEPYVRGTSIDFDVTVGPHQLFVLGDNRGETAGEQVPQHVLADGDGLVPETSVRGLAVWSTGGLVDGAAGRKARALVVQAGVGLLLAVAGAVALAAAWMQGRRSRRRAAAPDGPSRSATPVG
ncbi:S26 family signal peptidase [Kitasatospora sp. NE20-6]|uniref:S26 family signal peptidase n=1 Tax=Kitasatospora sp. NE20-6 TaxID=2859066 RepID=UPI0038B239D2